MKKNHLSSRVNFIIKGAFVLALALGIFAGALSHHVTLAQTNQSFVIQAGGAGLGNAEALVFAPQDLQVHRGDTVIWAVNGFHNIRFTDQGLLSFVLIPGVHDVEIPQINPAVAFPTLENGGSYTGGEANSGLPAGGPGGPTDTYGIFSLVLDVEPGTYTYLCDVHPGMAGTITVVDDATPVPDPIAVAIQAKMEIDQTLLMGSEAAQAEVEAAAGINTAGDDGVAHVQTGSGAFGRTTVNRYFGFTTVIQVGQSVTWTIPQTSPDPHTVTWPPLRGQDIAPIPQEGGPPILAFGPGFTPNVPENGEVGQGMDFNSGIMVPGQSFTLTFTEPGAYPFVCNIHPGMDGVVVVVE